MELRRVVVGVVALAVGIGCAHTRIKHNSGCWVKETENRIGDTRQVVAVCEPKAPKPSSDPLVRSVETCLFHAQMGWYTNAIERLQAGKGAPPAFDWEAASQKCLARADLVAQRKMEQLESRAQAAESRASALEDQNRELRATLISCVEKQPQAIATATSTSGSDARGDVGVANAAPGGSPPAIKRTTTSNTTTPSPATTTAPAPTPKPASSTSDSAACPSPVVKPATITR